MEVLWCLRGCYIFIIFHTYFYQPLQSLSSGIISVHVCLVECIYFHQFFRGFCWFTFFIPILYQSGLLSFVCIHCFCRRFCARLQLLHWSRHRKSSSSPHLSRSFSFSIISPWVSCLSWWGYISSSACTYKIEFIKMFWRYSSRERENSLLSCKLWGDWKCMQKKYAWTWKKTKR